MKTFWLIISAIVTIGAIHLLNPNGNAKNSFGEDTGDTASKMLPSLLLPKKVVIAPDDGVTSKIVAATIQTSAQEEHLETLHQLEERFRSFSEQQLESALAESKSRVTGLKLIERANDQTLSAEDRIRLREELRIQSVITKLQGYRLLADLKRRHR